MSKATLYEMTLGAQSVTLRLVYDPEGKRPALARGMGHALSYAGSALQGELRTAVLALGHAFEALGAAPRSTAEAKHALVEATRQTVPRATLEPVLGDSRDPGLPFWPSTLRIGAPSPAARGVWPFDAELAGLRLGLRRVVKREQFSEEALRADVEWLASNGVELGPASPPDVDGRRVLFGALDRTEIDRITELEIQLRRTDGSNHEAARRIGEALGYPKCCARAYLALTGRDDLTLARELLPPLPARPASPLTQWLNAPLALVSHTPCALDCAETQRLAGRLLAYLDEQHPGFAERWRELAARVQVVDTAGRCLAIAGTGSLADGVRITEVTELVMPQRADLSDIAREMREPTGRRLSSREGDLVLDGDDAWRGPLAADHRGRG